MKASRLLQGFSMFNPLQAICLIILVLLGVLGVLPLGRSAGMKV